MKCVFCGGKLETRDVTFSYEGEDRVLFVENVPAEICLKCGEKTYSIEVTDKLARFARNEYQPEKFIEVPVFNFAK